MSLAAGEIGAIEGRAAFEAAVAPELDHAYRLAGYLLGNAADAEDAVGEAVVRAWAGFASLRQAERFGPWLTRIVVNICRDRLRRRKVVSMVPLDDLEPPGADPFADALARDAVGRALGLLGPDQRTVVVMRYWNDLTVPEIARLLGIPGGTVKWRLHAACARMRTELERDMGDGEVSR